MVAAMAAAAAGDHNKREHVLLYSPFRAVIRQRHLRPRSTQLAATAHDPDNNVPVGGNGSGRDDAQKNNQRPPMPPQHMFSPSHQSNFGVNVGRIQDTSGRGSGDSGGEPTRPSQLREQELERRGSAAVPMPGMPVAAQEYDWRQSVFEFQSLNDPRSNLSVRSSSQRRADPTVQPDGACLPYPPSQLPTTTAKTGDGNNVAPLPPAPPAAAAVEKKTPEWFQFREKEALRKTEVDDEVKRLQGPRAVTAELATQLGLPASVSYDEIRKAYRAEIKRCHPDAASLESNELRMRALENRFMRLTAAWDKFVETHKRASTFGGGPAEEFEEDEPPVVGRTTRFSSDDDSAEDASSVESTTRTRYVVHEDNSSEVTQQRSAEAAAAVAAVKRSRTRRGTADPTPKKSGDFMDTGGSSC